jgi:hypothetical protein
MLDLDFSGAVAKSRFVVFRVLCPLAFGEQSKGDHVRRRVIIAAVGHPRLCPLPVDALIRSPWGYLQPG